MEMFKLLKDKQRKRTFHGEISSSHSRDNMLTMIVQRILGFPGIHDMPHRKPNASIMLHFGTNYRWANRFKHLILSKVILMESGGILIRSSQFRPCFHKIHWLTVYSHIHMLQEPHLYKYIYIYVYSHLPWHWLINSLQCQELGIGVKSKIPRIMCLL